MQSWSGSNGASSTDIDAKLTAAVEAEKQAAASHLAFAAAADD